MKSLWLSIKIGLRYIRSKKRNSFVSLISLVSVVGIALGVAALIVVLSVMNGFETGLKDKILGSASHADILAPDGQLENWQDVVDKSLKHKNVLAAAPYIEAAGMMITDLGAIGILLRGVSPKHEKQVSEMANSLIAGDIESLKPKQFKLVVGAKMAEQYALNIGDKVSVVVPETDASIIGIMPRTKRFEIGGIFKVGIYEFDSKLLLTDINDAAVLYKMDNSVSGVRLKVDDILKAPRVSREIMDLMDGYVLVQDWTQRYASFFSAIGMQKVAMFVILSLIIAVAAFNIVSTMVMVVTDKESEIAILRTLGMIPKNITAVFLIQGTIIGFVGTVIGLILGISLALNIEIIVPKIESLLGVKFLDADVYFLSELPSELHITDVIYIALLSFMMSVLATIYPARKAAKVHPAEALRYE